MATVESIIPGLLMARLAELVLVPALPVAWPNVSFSPPVGGYLRASYLPNANRRFLDRASDPHQRVGFFQVDACTPLNRGAIDAQEIAGRIAEHFACGTEMWSGILRVSVTKAPDIARAMPDGTHWMVPVSIPYECFA
jgi:hypothetical protein